MKHNTTRRRGRRRRMRTPASNRGWAGRFGDALAGPAASAAGRQSREARPNEGKAAGPGAARRAWRLPIVAGRAPTRNSPTTSTAGRRSRRDAFLPLFDRPAVTRPARHSGPPAATSRAAARSVASSIAFIEQRILDWLAERGGEGATADEAEVALDLIQSTGSARFSELARSGRIIRTARKRPTRRGRAAFVHVHPTHAQGGEAWQATS